MDELAELAWEPKDGKQIAPGSGERESWSELIIPRRLREAIAADQPCPARVGGRGCRRDRARRDLAGRAGREPADARVPDPRHPFRHLHRSVRCRPEPDDLAPRSARPGEQRLHGRAPGDGGGRGSPPPLRCGAVRQWDAPRVHRAEEGHAPTATPSRRHTPSSSTYVDELPAGVPLQRDLRGLRWSRRALRHRVHPVRALRPVERR